MNRRSTIIGTGSALPPRRVTNAELAERVETSHEWIVERIGIEARHIAGDGETRTRAVARTKESFLIVRSEGKSLFLKILDKGGVERLETLLPGFPTKYS